MERYRITEGVGIYYVTFTVVEWLPVFIAEEPCKIVTESLNFCIKNKNLRLNAYVLMPNHLHAVVFDENFDEVRLKHTIDDFQKFTGKQLSNHYSRMLPSYYAEVLKRNAGDDRQRRFWQPTQHPVGIVTEKFWQQKVNYMHWNPVRKGLVRNPEDWRFSSASFWLSEKNENDVILSGMDW
jgi:REP element-mobilizing transposase RayT